MKFAVAFVLIASVASTFAGPPPGIIECITEVGMNVGEAKSVFDKMSAGEDMDPALREKAGCASKCIFERMEVWKEGTIDPDSWEATLTKLKMIDDIPDTKEHVQRCRTLKGSDECDTAFLVMRCMTPSIS